MEYEQGTVIGDKEMSGLICRGHARPRVKRKVPVFQAGVLALLVSVAMCGLAQADATLIAHYGFDEAISGKTYDDPAVSTDYATLGSAVSINTTVDTVLGAGALDMTTSLGSTTAITDGAYTNNTFSWTDEALTFTFWWKAKLPVADTSHGAYVSMGTHPDGGARLDIKETTGTDFRVEVQGGGQDTAVNLDDGEWHFVAVTVLEGGEFQDIGMYTVVGGALTSDLNTSTSTLTIATGDSPLVFGDSVYDEGGAAPSTARPTATSTSSGSIAGTTCWVRMRSSLCMRIPRATTASSPDPPRSTSARFSSA